MKAMTFNEFAGAEALRVVEKSSPALRAGDAVVSASVSAVNPARTGYRIEDPRLEITHVQVTRRLEDHAKSARIVQFLDDRRLTPRVARHGTIPVENAADAYRMAEACGFRSRVVSTFSD